MARPVEGDLPSRRCFIRSIESFYSRPRKIFISRIKSEMMPLLPFEGTAAREAPVGTRSEGTPAAGGPSAVYLCASAQGAKHFDRTS